MDGGKQRTASTGWVVAIVAWGARLERALLAWAQHPKLATHAVIIAVLLAAPSLFIGFQLDDYVMRYLHSEREGAARLSALTSGGFGFANGNPADNHFQIEAGYAPWWMPEDLRISFFRPLSVLLHRIDFWLFQDARFMHAHSLLWLAVLIGLATRLYRALLGPLVGGVAAILLAFDHTRGFAVGFIANRHALISAVLCVACLLLHRRARQAGDLRVLALSLATYLTALLASEASIAVLGYLLAFAIFLEDGPLTVRARSLSPYLVLTLAWRLWYDAAGYGAAGSGLYVDPGREPLHFVAALARRAPIQALGQLALPPSDLYLLYPPSLVHGVWLLGMVLCVGFVLALLPVLRRQASARFWALGSLLALIPASAGYPSGRQLLLVSLAAMPLIAQLWHFHVSEGRSLPRTRTLQLSQAVAALVFGVHLFVSPFAAPLTSCGVALSAPLARAADDLGPEIAGKDVVFVTSPDYFSVRLAQFRKRFEGDALPHRFRALAFGQEPVTVTREDARTLVLDYAGGILSREPLEFYRDRRLRMHEGQRVVLDELTITVLAVTHDGRPSRVRFAFAHALGSPRFVFYLWRDNGYAKLTPPRIGERATLPAAELRLAL